MEALQKDCDKWAPGIDILFIRITKSKIPPTIAKNYEMIEYLKAMRMIAIEEQRVIETKAETQRRVEQITALMEADVNTIKMAREIDQTKKLLLKQELINTIIIEKEKTLAKEYLIYAEAIAEINEYLLTEEYLMLEEIKAFTKNAILFVGIYIPPYYKPLLP